MCRHFRLEEFYYFALVIFALESMARDNYRLKAVNKQTNAGFADENMTKN